jgi:hypothetical protein
MYFIYNFPGIKLKNLNEAGDHAELSTCPFNANSATYLGLMLNSFVTASRNAKFSIGALV